MEELTLTLPACEEKDHDQGAAAKGVFDKGPMRYTVYGCAECVKNYIADIKSQPENHGYKNINQGEVMGSEGLDETNFAAGAVPYIGCKVILAKPMTEHNFMRLVKNLSPRPGASRRAAAGPGN